ncbi:MAG: hypothetical protein LBI61_01250 [Puniceicoccales bacterium]|nr:hypothetical protein [Puniceicoccales bacterium]
MSGCEESFANLAAKCAVGDEQKAEFEETARFVFSVVLTGASAAGMAKGALRGPKPKIQGTAKVVKPSSVAAREIEVAGTGMKVPLVGHGKTPPVSRKMENHSSGEMPKPKALPRELAIPNKVNPTMRAKVERDCGVKMPDNLAGYTKHGLDRALSKNEVGVSPQSIIDTWKNPTKIEFETDKYGGHFSIFGETSVISINKDG